MVKRTVRSLSQGDFTCRHCGTVIDGTNTRSIGQHRRRCRVDTVHSIARFTQQSIKTARLLHAGALQPRAPTSAALRSMRDGREYRLHPTHAQRRAAVGVQVAGKGVRHGAATGRGVLRNTIPFIVRGAGSLRPSIVKSRVTGQQRRPSMLWMCMLVEKEPDVGVRVPDVPPIAAEYVSYEPRSLCAVPAREPPDRFKQPHENC